jgi:acyl-coenzyme A synthetase/AMP-(fatty) acid ligase
MTDTRHLVNGTLNWAENMLLAHMNRRSTTQRAVIACNEAGFDVILTYEELYQQVRKAAHALRKLGVKEGDRVAAFAPNNAEAVVMLLATTSIGAVRVSCLILCKTSPACRFGLLARQSLVLTLAWSVWTRSSLPSC